MAVEVYLSPSEWEAFKTLVMSNYNVAETFAMDAVRKRHMLMRRAIGLGVTNIHDFRKSVEVAIGYVRSARKLRELWIKM